MTALSLAFMGTPVFAVPCLEALLAAGHRVVRVYTQPPRPVGRGNREQRSPVHESALRHGLEVETPASLKDAAVQAAYELAHRRCPLEVQAPDHSPPRLRLDRLPEIRRNAARVEIAAVPRLEQDAALVGKSTDLEHT